MRTLLRKRREGFSLIELLIVVAIIAALVGVAVPFFQDNLSEAQRTKAGQDIEVIKKAISLYDAREARPLVGTALAPLLGRYMQELPKDPWGNDYLYDGAAGLLASYGADALPEGTGGDTDITVYTKAPLMINRVQYAGAWGRPNPPRSAATTADYTKKGGNKFIITLTKPVDISAGITWEDEVALLREAGKDATAGGIALDDTTDTSWNAATWVAGSETTNFADPDSLHKPDLGVLTLRCEFVNHNVPAAQSITPTMALDFTLATDTGAANAVGTIIKESTYQSYDPSSPMDTAVYGTDVITTSIYGRDPQPVELVNGKRQGIKIEKY